MDWFERPSEKNTVPAGDEPADASADERSRDPICVDLDGTLINTNTLHELALLAALEGRSLLRLPFWLSRGRAHLKRQLARGLALDASLLPYNETLLAYLREQRARGRRLILATAADRGVATAINAHLNLFDEIIASDGERNLRGAAKAAALSTRFGDGRFTYAGNDRTDIKAWRVAAGGIIVNSRPGVARAARNATKIEYEISDRPSRIRMLIKALRPHQWAKNILVFAPIFAANALSDTAGWLAALIMFTAFCLTASAIYLVNDLTDLAADRRHPRKRHRPFASGALPIGVGAATAPLLAAGGFALASCCGGVPILLCYAAFSLLYSLKLKEKPLVDIFGLAALYTIRLFGGGETTGHPVSLWLLAFSSFLFLSLAAVKRVSELLTVDELIGQALSRRGYAPGDQRLLEMMGVSASFVSSMVLALYVQSDWVQTHWHRPEWLWFMVPLMLFWQCRLWLSTTRGYMDDDPIVYAAKDWVSQLVAIAVVLILMLASGRLNLGISPAWNNF